MQELGSLWGAITSVINCRLASLWGCWGRQEFVTETTFKDKMESTSFISPKISSVGTRLGTKCVGGKSILIPDQIFILLMKKSLRLR